MSALAFVRRGDGVLGVPGARGKQCQLVAVLGALDCGERRRGSVRCSDACWRCQVAALRAQSQYGAVLCHRAAF